MDWAVGTTKRALDRHGLDLVYTKTVRTVDPIEATVSEVCYNYTLKIYPKPVQVNQYNYPTLVDKQVVMFYLAADGLPFEVQPSDRITYQGDVYRVNSFQAHTAHGKVILYKLLGVKG
jgi:hypothetical protein